MTSSSSFCVDELTSRLEYWFRSCPAAAVAYSGGVDSSLVAYIARRLLGRDRAVAYISASPSLKSFDLELARQFCTDHEIALEVIQTDELENPDYARNPIDRCFFCKTMLYGELSARLPDDGSVWMLNGTNCDDYGDWRPGLTAAETAGVRSPLAECGLDKSAVRHLAAHFELACCNKPASPCLASRIPYGQPVTHAKLQRIDAAEALLCRLEFEEVRVRHDRDRAMVEVPVDRLCELERIWPGVAEKLVDLGFHSVERDSEGLVSGKLNRPFLA